jgi:O-acetyl-ADP-ribose deacetylase
MAGVVREGSGRIVSNPHLDAGGPVVFEAIVDGVDIELVEGDITDQAGFDAVVNAANAELLPGGGVAGAIHRAAGPTLAEECRPLAPIRPGECVITAGHGLPNPCVIHCLGPVYGLDEPADELLASCYRGALELADERGLASVAFPAISTGAFGYPMERGAEVALREVLSSAGVLRKVSRVRFVLLGSRALQTHGEVLERLTGERG